MVVLVIILRNTIYLERAINALRQYGIAFPNALLTHVSPIGWEHINVAFLVKDVENSSVNKFQMAMQR